MSAIGSNLFLAKGSFEPSDRVYGNDHLIDMGAIALEIPSDRGIIRITTSAPVTLNRIAPGTSRQRIIVENANAAIVLTIAENDPVTGVGNITMGLDYTDGANNTRTLQAGNNMEFWYDKSRSLWVGITVPAVVDGGTFI